MSQASSYQVFGGVLRSELPVPELEALDSAPEPDWVVTVGRGAPRPFDGESVGTETVTDEATVEMFASEDGFRLVFTDTGTFDFSDGGRQIVWYPNEDSDWDAAAVDLLGRCLAVSLHLEGAVCLHGSAVAFDHGAIAFMAPKHHGKSTTALALVKSGARLLSDDALPIRLGANPRAYPGVHAVRLWEDSAAQVAVDQKQRVGLGGKLVVNRMDPDTITHDDYPLAAIYLLVPVESNEGVPAAHRTRLSSLESAVTLVGQAKIGGLLQGREAPVALERSLELAESVPVYQMAVARDFDRLPDMVATVREWHADLIAANAATAETTP